MLIIIKGSSCGSVGVLSDKLHAGAMHRGVSQQGQRSHPLSAGGGEGGKWGGVDRGECGVWEREVVKERNEEQWQQGSRGDKQIRIPWQFWQVADTPW